MDYYIPQIIDCECKRRYMRTAISTAVHEIGHFRCECGNVVGAWNGPYRLAFEPEEAPTAH